MYVRSFWLTLFESIDYYDIPKGGSNNTYKYSPFVGNFLTERHFLSMTLEILVVDIICDNFLKVHMYIIINEGKTINKMMSTILLF